MAKKFKDTKGREWSIKITFGTLEDIHEEVGTDILSDPTSVSLEPRKWVEMIWLAIQDNARDLGVSPEDFGKSLDGQTLRSGMDAFMEDLSDFLLPLMPEQSAVLTATWKAVNEGRQQKANIVLEMLGKPFGESAELLASIPELYAGGSLLHSSTGNTPKPGRAPQKRRRRRRKANPGNTK